LLGDIPEASPPEDRAAVTSIFAGLMETLVDQREERVVLAGTANLARFSLDFPLTIGPVLEALEEHVVLLRLLGEATDAATLRVRIGHEHSHEGLATTSVVSVGYGAGDEAVAGLGVLGPTRMDYPGTMGAVRAVARYVGQILAGS
jgi:heat-inducible transcriptional repressor